MQFGKTYLNLFQLWEKLTEVCGLIGKKFIDILQEYMFNLHRRYKDFVDY